MTEPELFDGYSDTYRDEVERSISFAGGSLDHYTALKAMHLLEVTARHVGDPQGLTALDVGCGTGETDRFLVGRFGRLVGVDVASGPLARARDLNPTAEYAAYDGDRLPFGDDSVDVSFAICVMHHVPPGKWSTFLDELARVTRPGGLVAVFEHNPLNPLTRHAVSNCEFDEDALLLQRSQVAALLRSSTLEVVEQAYIVFLPWGNGRVDRLLARVPLGAQHYVAARVP